MSNIANVDIYPGQLDGAFLRCPNSYVSRTGIRVDVKIEQADSRMVSASEETGT